MEYADKIIFNDIKYDKVYNGSELVVKTEIEPTKALSFTALENSVIRFVKATDSPEVFPINMQYRYEYDSRFTDFGTDYIRLNKGEKIYVIGDNPNGLSYYDEDTELWKHSHFIIDLGKVEANGNIMSILDGGRCTRMDVPEYCFYGLFKDCTALVTAPAIQAETLGYYCYGEMFSGCTSLIKSPNLLSKTLDTGCYYNMFAGCTSLTTPSDLPADMLQRNCYIGMYRDCTSLVNAPAISANRLASGCFYMMFKGCTSLTKAPELLSNSSVEHCYWEMFQDCINLNYVKCATKVYDSINFSDWLTNVSPTGDFYCYDASIFPRGTSGIPDGWTVHSEV